ncbi:MAG: sn-glycerol-3-phosphate ABC transporter ATP-binding protein UgpC [Paraglaciecola sp.]|uniref:ABC transporter ATP-binding protein n=1 Tax=Paraglaciecola sp. TaxID=1920173 RepID=UPI0032972D50
MAKIELIDIKKQYGDTKIVKGVTFTVEDGEFAVVVGPSGCGKSTLLRMIAGLEDITSGELRIDGKVANQISPDKRGIAMVFQSYALYPHLTVAENIGFALTLKKHDKAEVAQRVKEAAKMLQLEDLLQRKPAELSGGQRQRVAIGRAIVKRPKVILFDEPLSNLDAKLRVQMRAELQRLHKEFGSTIVYVTHDQVEAMTMAEKIVVLNQGHISQLGKPMDLYQQPQNTFVAEFIGIPKMNLLDGEIQKGETNVFVCSNGLRIPLAANYQWAGKGIKLGIRPEHIDLADNDQWQYDVKIIERLGIETYLHLQRGKEDVIVVRLEGDHDLDIDKVSLHFPSELCRLFNEEGQVLLPNVI